MDVSWRRTNAHIWQWTCKDCGRVEKIKEVGRETPSPSSGYAPSTPPARASSSDSVAPSMQMPRSPAMTSGGGETMFHGQEDWMNYRDLLERMVTTHMSLHGAMTHQEFLHTVNPTLLCYRTFSYTTMQNAIPASTTSRSTRSSVADEGSRLFSFGKHKGQRFDQVYEFHPDYVDWTLREMDQSDGYCQGMKRWMKYCRDRISEEQAPTAYMVEAEEEAEEDEGLYLYLDSGCNHTCHGELWLKKFVEKTGYEPIWLHQEEKELNGIGGKTKTLARESSTSDWR